MGHFFKVEHTAGGEQRREPELAVAGGVSYIVTNNISDLTGGMTYRSVQELKRAISVVENALNQQSGNWTLQCRGPLVRGPS